MGNWPRLRRKLSATSQLATIVLTGLGHLRLFGRASTVQKVGMPSLASEHLILRRFWSMSNNFLRVKDPLWFEQVVASPKDLAFDQEACRLLELKQDSSELHLSFLNLASWPVQFTVLSGRDFHLLTSSGFLG